MIAGAIYKRQDKDTSNAMEFNKNQLYNETEFNFSERKRYRFYHYAIHWVVRVATHTLQKQIEAVFDTSNLWELYDYDWTAEDDRQRNPINGLLSWWLVICIDYQTDVFSASQTASAAQTQQSCRDVRKECSYITP